jgi:DMSO reductase anchor subunit
MDEIVCAIIYAVYITMYVYMMRNFKDCKPFTRFVMPALAIVGSLFFVVCGTGLYQLVFTGSWESIKAFGAFMLLFALMMAPCLFFYHGGGKDLVNEEH